jgi:hypothetical protein
MDRRPTRDTCDRARRGGRVKPDLDLDALAEAIAQADRPSWLARLARRFLVKAIGPTVASVAIGILLARLGVNLGSLLMPTVYAGPFIAVAVASFVAHAWRRNSTTPVYGTGQEPGHAEAGQVASPVGQVQPDLARPVATLPPATVTVIGVTPLPAPAAALPQAVGQTVPIHYPTPAAEEDTP